MDWGLVVSFPIIFNKIVKNWQVAKVETLLAFFDDFAAGDGADDLAAGIDDHFAFARLKVDGAVDDGPLAELDDLLAFEGVVFTDGDPFEMGGGEEGFLGEDGEGF